MIETAPVTVEFVTHDGGRIDRRESTDDSGVEGRRQRGVIAGMKADLAHPPRRGLRSAVFFALSSALVGGAAVALAVTGDEPRMLVLGPIAGQWFLAVADVLPVRIRRTAPALRVLGLAFLIGGGVGWWLS